MKESYNRQLSIRVSKEIEEKLRSLNIKFCLKNGELGREAVVLGIEILFNIIDPFYTEHQPKDIYNLGHEMILKLKTNERREEENGK